MLLTIITFVLVLSLLVFVHELGHFITARRFGIKAEEFGFGFPPRVWGMYKNAEGKWKHVWGKREVTDCPTTVYSINLIPMGGFVKIKGEDGESLEKDSFAVRKIWQRAVVLSAGVLMNIILAAVLISSGLMIGMPQDLEELSPGAVVRDRQIQIIQIASPSPAKDAGIMVGDIIISINGQTFDNYQSIQKITDENVGKSLDYKIKRGTEIIDFMVTPEMSQEVKKGIIGVNLVEIGIVKYPWYRAIWQGVQSTASLTWAILVAFYDLFRGLVLGHGVSGDVAGPVGIATLTGRVARMGLIYVLQFTALLSINLAIINFLPFPALDGGRVLFLIIEKIKGSPVKRKVENVIHNIGFALLMLLVLVVTFRDVLKVSDKLRSFWDVITGVF